MKYQNWKPLWKDPLISGNKAEELEQRFADLIKQQIWQPGEVIPPQQVIARKLHISKGTVEKAFQHLVKMNVIFTRRGKLSHISGSYILSKTELYMLSHLEADHVNRFPVEQGEIAYIQLGNSYPPLYELNIDTYIQGFISTLRAIKKGGMGLEARRQHTDAALKMILESREILVADNEYTMVPKGRALDLVARLLFAKGGLLIMDVANDLSVARSFITAGAHVKYTGINNGVMDMDRLEQLCLTGMPVAVFVRSAASYLEGRSLPEESRNRLLALASKHQFELICMHEHTEMWLKVPRKPLLLRSGNAGIIYVSPLSNLNAMTDDLALVVAHSAFIDVTDKLCR